MVSVDDLAPFLQDICKRIKHTPSSEHLNLLSKIQVKEMSIFFDARGTMSDTEMYDKCVYYSRLREQGKAKNFDIHATLPESEKGLTKDGAPAPTSAPKNVKVTSKTEVEVVKKEEKSPGGSSGQTYVATATKRTYDSTVFGKHAVELSSVNNQTLISIQNEDQRELSCRVCIAKDGDIQAADGAEICTPNLIEVVVPPFKSAKVCTVACPAADVKFTTATRHDWK